MVVVVDCRADVMKDARRPQELALLVSEVVQAGGLEASNISSERVAT